MHLQINDKFYIKTTYIKIWQEKVIQTNFKNHQHITRTNSDVQMKKKGFFNAKS